MSILTPPIGPPDHTLGSTKAKVTLTEYGDFQCPYCGAAYSIVKEIITLYGKELRFAFRHFPLTEIHPDAGRAAEAAEAADAEGKFWGMHDLLFENQERLDELALLDYARTLDLDLEDFQEALERETFRSKVERDFWSGVHSGVNGTPTFFINGQRYDGSWEFNTLLDAIHRFTDVKRK